MKKHYVMILVAAMGFQACAAGYQGSELSQEEKASRFIQLGLMHYDQQNFIQAADAFGNTADIYLLTGDRAMEKNALIAKAKVQLKHSDRHGFIETMARYLALMEGFEMADKDVQVLIVLYEKMLGKDRYSYRVPRIQHLLTN